MSDEQHENSSTRNSSPVPDCLQCFCPEHLSRKRSCQAASSHRLLCRYRRLWRRIPRERHNPEHLITDAYELEPLFLDARSDHQHLERLRGQSHGNDIQFQFSSLLLAKLYPTWRKCLLRFYGESRKCENPAHGICPDLRWIDCPTEPDSCSEPNGNPFSNSHAQAHSHTNSCTQSNGNTEAHCDPFTDSSLHARQFERLSLH